MTKKSWIILGSTLGGVALTSAVILPLTLTAKHHSVTTTNNICLTSFTNVDHDNGLKDNLPPFVFDNNNRWSPNRSSELPGATKDGVGHDLPPSDNGLKDRDGHDITGTYSFFTAEANAEAPNDYGNVMIYEKVNFYDAKIHFNSGGADPTISLYIETYGGTDPNNLPMINVGTYTFAANQKASKCHYAFSAEGFPGHNYDWEIKGKSVKDNGDGTAKFRLDTWVGPPFDSGWSWGINNQYCDMSATIV